MIKQALNSVIASRFNPATVLHREQLSPHMIRLTFRTRLAADLSAHAAGGYTKLLVPAPGESELRGLEDGHFKSRMRTYTIRHVRPSKEEIDIDFVVHGDEGVVGPWASRAAPGDQILMSRPGMLKYTPDGADGFLFAADLAALPAAAAMLERLPRDAFGEAFFEIPSDADKQVINAPPGIEIRWLTKADPADPSTSLLGAIKGSSAPAGQLSVFVAGEFSWVGDLRSFFRNQRKAPPHLTYMSSYWKVGAVEPEHKAAKARAA